MTGVCRNCGAPDVTPRWCRDCWRMIVKTASGMLISAVLTWAAQSWLTLTKHVLGWVFN